MDQVFLPYVVAEDLRRPEAAKIRPAEEGQLLLPPVDQVVAAPQGKAFAAVVVAVLPIHVVPRVHAMDNAQVRGQNHIAAVFQLREGDIPAAARAPVAGQYGSASVERFPAGSVPADGEIDLLPVRRQFFFEM